MSVESFMAAYTAATQESGTITGYPARWWPSGARTAVYDYPARGYVYLAYIKSDAPGKRTGAGSAALHGLVALADQHGVTIELIASAARKAGGPNTRALMSWYKRHGFIREHGYRMTRPHKAV